MLTRVLIEISKVAGLNLSGKQHLPFERFDGDKDDGLGSSCWIVDDVYMFEVGWQDLGRYLAVTT